MNPNLKPVEPLSQVVFIHDYIQLVFQHERFNIYNPGEIEISEKTIKQGQTGFCDALVSLIDQHITEVSTDDAYKLILTFEGGASFRVTKAAEWPEAFEFSSPNQLLVVEPNA